MNTILAILAVNAMLISVPEEVLVSVCEQESNLRSWTTAFHDGNGRHSHGLCQVQSRTAKGVGFKGVTEDLYNPLVNSFYAAKYLRYQYDRYGNWDDAIAAYNAGRVKRRKNGEYINQRYVTQVKERINEFKANRSN